jgi:hypothetical protein
MRLVRWSILVAALALGCQSATAPTPGPVLPSGSGCARTFVGLTPLNQPGIKQSYLGTALGLYPGGGSTIPGNHFSAGLQQAGQITPLNANGQPNAQGRYALISIGMSNTTQEFQAFIAMNPSPNPRLAIIDGAQGGQTASDWAQPNCPCWATLNDRIRQAGLTNAQVVSAWIKLANSGPTGPWPNATVQLKNDTLVVVRALASRFPNLRVAYLSSRIYAGYATTHLNPEPFAYESGFAMRWVIEEQLAGRLPFTGGSRVAPWLAWGPYLWADGLLPRSDGLTWTCEDFAVDGTHPSTSGRQKVAQLLRNFFTTDATARPWFTGQ